MEGSTSSASLTIFYKIFAGILQIMPEIIKILHLTPVLFRFSRHGERIVSKNPIYIFLCSLKGTHIIPCLLVLCVHGFFLRQELGVFCLQTLDGGQFFQPLLVKKLLCRLMQNDLGFMLRKKLFRILRFFFGVWLLAPEIIARSASGV